MKNVTEVTVKLGWLISRIIESDGDGENRIIPCDISVAVAKRDELGASPYWRLKSNDENVFLFERMNNEGIVND